MEAQPISVDTTLLELEDLAKRKLPKEAWDILGAAETGSTFRRNIEFFSRILLKQRVLQGVARAETESELFGTKISTPVMVAPIGSCSEIGSQAEHDVIEGTRKAGSALFVSCAYKLSIEEIAKVPHPPLMWQAYFNRGYDYVRDTIKKAEQFGFAAAGVTVDTVLPVKIGDKIPPGRSQGNVATPEQVRGVRKETSLPFFVKGVLCHEDAVLAVESGADIIVVSNHGGRIGDYCCATIEVLPEIVKAVGNKATVLVDGGFRRGSDVLKALAMGAKGVLIGRPIYWGAAVSGSEGVSTVISKLTEELRRSMIICGVSSINDITDQVLVRSNEH